jgi:peptidoglycan/xylan/chitin deacetylase (PgdA/CDA1 family)
MRSVLSAGARRWARLWSLPATRSGAKIATLALLALALVAVVVQAASTRGAARAPGASRTLAQTPATPAPNRYRLIGCRSHGSDAYLHGPRRREVAIGFDDGPSRETPAFVRMLERSRAPATFFMIGKLVSAPYRDMLLRELRDGDVLGDHTFTHADLTRSGGASAQLHQTIAAIRSLTGYTPCVFRPPYGAYDKSVIRSARALGLATVLWNVDPSDYLQPGTGTIERRILAQVQPGSIIISHDGGGSRRQTLAAYPRVIAKLRARGYRIVTIPELLGFRPAYVPCSRLCDGIGVLHHELPHDAILEKAP